MFRPCHEYAKYFRAAGGLGGGSVLISKVLTIAQTPLHPKTFPHRVLHLSLPYVRGAALVYTYYAGGKRTGVVCAVFLAHNS